MSKKKKKQKRAAFNFASGGVLIIAACVFIFSLYQLITMLIPYYSGGEEYAITADEEGKGFTVDFDALLKENEDTVAWIRFDEPAVINYPVVKSADNNEYLTKTFTANDNKLGAIFVDMRNSNDFSDKNILTSEEKCFRSFLNTKMNLSVRSIQTSTYIHRMERLEHIRCSQLEL